jgi:DNA-directed RNA polymerase specialized sigma24 family protein
MTPWRPLSRPTAKCVIAEPRDVPTPAPPSPFADLLTKLPPAELLLLELFFVHDCSYEKIASMLGISVESVGKQKTRALEKLKGQLE